MIGAAAMAERAEGTGGAERDREREVRWIAGVVAAVLSAVPDLSAEQRGAVAGALRAALGASPRPGAGGEDRERILREVADILSASRHAFRSKQVQRARELLQTLLA